MAEQSLWRRMVAAIEREYERRIRAASLVTEYGAQHHVTDPHGAGHAEVAAEPEDGEVAEIVNVPKGTRLANHTRPTSEQ